MCFCTERVQYVGGMPSSLGQDASDNENSVSILVPKEMHVVEARVAFLTLH